MYAEWYYEKIVREHLIRGDTLVLVFDNHSKMPKNKGETQERRDEAQKKRDEGKEPLPEIKVEKDMQIQHDWQRMMSNRSVRRDVGAFLLR